MSEKVQRVPAGFHTVSPHLTVKNAPAMIEFYTKAFGAKERRRALTPDGKVLHAEVQIGDSVVFLNDEFPDMGSVAPASGKGTSIVLHIYVEDVDSLWQKAVAAGAKIVMPLADQFWGDRYGIVLDPSGHSWSMASHIRDRTQEEMKADAEQMFKK
jgi:PhnB protein